MTTLADVNATLGVTNIALAGVSKNTEKTNEGIVDFLDYLTVILEINQTLEFNLFFYFEFWKT